MPHVRCDGPLHFRRNGRSQGCATARTSMPSPISLRRLWRCILAGGSGRFVRRARYTRDRFEKCQYSTPIERCGAIASKSQPLRSSVRVRLRSELASALLAVRCSAHGRREVASGHSQRNGPPQLKINISASNVLVAGHAGWLALWCPALYFFCCAGMQLPAALCRQTEIPGPPRLHFAI